MISLFDVPPPAQEKRRSVKVSGSQTGWPTYVRAACCVGVKLSNGVPEEKQWPRRTYGINHAWPRCCIRNAGAYVTNV